MSRETKISIIAIAGILVLIAAVIAVNFIIYPVCHTYMNEDGQTRVKISGAVYKYMTDTQWAVDAKTANRIGYLDDIDTSLYGYEGDGAKNAVYAYTPGASKENHVLIKEELELGSALAENVYRIRFDDPEINEYIKMFLDASFETADESMIAAFFDALGDSSMKLTKDEVSREDMTKAFTLKCYNKALHIASVDYTVYVWKGQFLCYDKSADVYTEMPAEVFTQIAGGGFDANTLLEG